VLPAEKHYRIRDLAKLWGFSRQTIANLFASEPGCLRIYGTGARKYVSTSVPESVALRVRERLMHQPLQPSLPSLRPPRIVRLRYLHGAMPKKS
jgi:hypothetical protein